MAARYANYATNNPNSFVTNTTLAALADPGTPAAREDLMFRERAFWLFGTGHRLGDMRRMIRQYGRGRGDCLSRLAPGTRADPSGPM